MALDSSTRGLRRGRSRRRLRRRCRRQRRPRRRPPTVAHRCSRTTVALLSIRHHRRASERASNPPSRQPRRRRATYPRRRTAILPRVRRNLFEFRRFERGYVRRDAVGREFPRAVRGNGDTTPSWGMGRDLTAFLRMFAREGKNSSPRATRSGLARSLWENPPKNFTRR